MVKAATKAEIMKAPIREDTNPTIYSLPSMKNLLLFISAATGSPPPGRRPGTVGSHLYKLAGLRPLVIRAFTLVNTHPGKEVQRIVKDCFKVMFPNRLAVGPVFGRVNISSKYRDSAWPTPGGSAGPVSYHLSIPGTASTGKYSAWTPAWRGSVFPVALSCKAQPVISYLLY